VDAVPPTENFAGDVAGDASAPAAVDAPAADSPAADVADVDVDVDINANDVSEASANAEVSETAVPVSEHTKSLETADAAPTRIMIDGVVEAIEVTSAVDAMFNDSLLFHRLSQSDVDAVDICKSYAFDMSQVNWHLANTEEWMRTYAITNQHRDFFKRNGLIATIAFDFLGVSGFKCAVGTSHLCTVDCPTVVRSVENLETARHVYFTLVSASHMLTVMEIIDVSRPLTPTRY
jgi:hypothetical protein